MKTNQNGKIIFRQIIQKNNDAFFFLNVANNSSLPQSPVYTVYLQQRDWPAYLSI